MWIHAQSWSEATFGSVQLGDARRTQRAVQFGAALLRHPAQSLPQQLKHWAATKAAYRWLDDDQIDFPSVMQPHWEQTRAAACGKTVLLIQDTTDLDYTGRAIEGLGPIGDDRGYGCRLHTVLAVQPDPRRVLGIAYQQPFVRQKRGKKGENSAQRAKRARESQRWEQAVAAIGPVPADSQWVYVCDREGDIFSFYRACADRGSDFVVRLQTDRCVQVVSASGEPQASHLLTEARSLPARFEKAVTVSLKAGGQRQTRVAVSWGALTLQPPQHSPQQPALAVAVVRAWEREAPPAGEEAVEWLLLTSLSVTDEATAAQCLHLYELRWLVEDYHQCLKTGCRVEQRQVQTKDRLWRLLGLLSAVAVQLLQWREAARAAVDALAQQELPADWVQVVAHLAGCAPKQLTLHQFWWTLAQQGGYLGRRGDGPPGWKTIWRGWLEVEPMVRGFHLAAQSYE